MVSGTTANLGDVWGSGPNDVFVTAGTILHLDGSGTWTPMASGSASYFDVWGVGPGDVMAVGQGGAIAHYDGITWSPMRTGTATILRSVWGTAGRFVAAGDGGTILSLGRSCEPAESSCGDGEDDDCDGRYDCGDSDCVADAFCVAGGLCQGALPIACNVSVAGATNVGTRAIDRYACSGWQDNGREAFYQLDATSTGSVTVSLTGMTADLDLIVLANGAGGACEPRNPGCLVASSTRGNETVTFNATAGSSYTIVVDGFASNAGVFTLGVTCF